MISNFLRVDLISGFFKKNQSDLKFEKKNQITSKKKSILSQIF